MSYPTHIVAAGGIVENKNNEILLVKTYFRGWEYPGGQVENGESLDEALEREIIEESGIKVRVKRLIGIYSNIQEKTGHDGITHVPTKVMMDFVCEYVEGEFRPSNETSEGMWVKRDKILDFVIHPAYVYRYSVYLKNLSSPVYSVYQSKPFKVFSERKV